MHSKNILLVALLWCCFLFTSRHPVHATTYYVSATGDDTQSGTSAATAWRTTSRVEAATFQPSDRILFEAGQVFSGGFQLHGQGTPTQPIIVSSYGTGRATIASGTGYGILSYNKSGIEIRRLNIMGSGRLSNNSSGILFYIDQPNTSFPYLRMDSLDVSGYLVLGIGIGSNCNSGYSDVRITACQLHDNGEDGFYSYGPDTPVHSNWYIGNCQAYNNSGRSDVTQHNTGNGIVVGAVDNCIVEYCQAYNNGWLSADGSNGPAGIWGVLSNKLIIQYCESHHNIAGGRFDGSGFDLDGGCTYCILQYNYSHDNQGPGYVLAQYPGAPPMHDLIVRYNISDNDARKFGQGALEVWSSGSSGGIARASFYNNTVRLGPAIDNSQAKAIKVMSFDLPELTFRNNILHTTGDVPVLSTPGNSSQLMQGNCYWNASQSMFIDNGGTIYTDLATWRAATGQEKLADGRTTGINQDPQFAATLTVPPAASSPVVGAGLSLFQEFGVVPGPRDFVGAPTPTPPAVGNIGAIEAPVISPLPVSLVSFSVARNGPDARLRWETASELRNAYFAVEASSDGHSFAQLSQVPGHGTTTQAHTYQYVDAKLASYPAGPVYYRLRQVDYDGHPTYSPTYVLNDTGLVLASPLQVYPNPAATAATVQVAGASAKTSVQLLDAQGRLLATVQTSADGTAKLSMIGQAPGLYLVRCGTQAAKLLLTP